MWPIGAFFMGLFSFGIAGASGVKEAYKREELEANYRKGNHSPYNQFDYENKTDGFDFIKVSDEIYSRMPSYGRLFANGLARVAISKRLMEENTIYNYQVPDKYFGYPMEEFTKDSFRTITTYGDIMLGSLIYKGGYRNNKKKKYIPKKIHIYKTPK